jgi:hypothetical protein
MMQFRNLPDYQELSILAFHIDVFNVFTSYSNFQYIYTELALGSSRTDSTPYDNHDFSDDYDNRGEVLTSYNFTTNRRGEAMFRLYDITKVKTLAQRGIRELGYLVCTGERLDDRREGYCTSVARRG